MSIIKKPYEIAVYDDVLQDNNTFQEVRLGIIGSDKMEGQNRVQEPNFVRNINGQNTLTFKMYKTYTDIVTGEKIDNPFCDWLVNERKVKLHYEDKWYDFIVKDIQEESTNYLYSYSLEDANVQELSRNGFNIVLDAELQNNIGTAVELGTEVMAETDWEVEGDVAVQTIEEALVYVTIPAGTVTEHLLDQTDTESGVTSVPYTFIESKTALAFYSSCKNKPHRFQFIYVNGTYTKNDNRVITNKDCQYYIDFPTPESDYSEYSDDYDLWLPEDWEIASPGAEDTVISTKYRGARYGFAQQAQYIPLLSRYCQKYTKQDNNDIVIDMFGYEDTEYISPTLLQNYITNYGFESKTGWTAAVASSADRDSDFSVENVYGRFSGGKFISLFDDYVSGAYSESLDYAAYMKMTFNKVSQFVLNSCIRDNRTLIKNLSKDSKLVLDYSVLNSSGGAATDNFTFSLGEYVYNTNNGTYNPKQAPNIVFSNPDSISGHLVFNVDNTDYTEATFKKNCKVYLKIIPSTVGTYYIQKISLYPRVLDSNGNIVTPEDDYAAEWVDKSKLYKKYTFFEAKYVDPNSPDYCNNVEDLPVYQTESIDYSVYNPVYNSGAEKVRAVTVKESNYFNILQTIAETFEQWITFDITRDASGAIESKTIRFKNYVGDENYACFRYGVNLKDITRVNTSKEIVTKLIVKPNNNELAENGFCTIQRAGSNPTGENYIYDFQYYQNKGLINAQNYVQQNYYLDSAAGPDYDLWPSGVISSIGSNLNGYFPRVNKINSIVIPINDELANKNTEMVSLRSDLNVNELENDAAVQGIEESRENFIDLVGKDIDEVLVLDYSTVQLDSYGISPASGASLVMDSIGGWIEGNEVHVLTASMEVLTPSLHSSAWTITSSNNVYTASFSGDHSDDWAAYVHIDGASYNQNDTYILKYDLHSSEDIKSISVGGNPFYPTSSDKQPPIVIVTDNKGIKQKITYPSATEYVTCDLPTGEDKWYTITVIGTFYLEQEGNWCLYCLPRYLNTGSNVVTCRMRNLRLMRCHSTARQNDVPFMVNCGVGSDENPNTSKPFFWTDAFPKTARYYDAKNSCLVDVNRSDVSKILTEWRTYIAAKSKTDKTLPNLRQAVENKQTEIDNLIEWREKLLEDKRILNNLFFTKYSRFIQEGTWISEEYVDDEKYFADAQSVLYGSCYPQVSYSINVFELSKLPGYEQFKFNVGDKTWAIDDEFFGEGIREEVIITELTENLDDPSQNNIKVQNFKNQFQDLFQAIIATVQQTQYNSGAYEKGAALVDANESIKSQFVTDAINRSASFLAPGHTHTVTWEGGNGITVTDDTIPTNQVRIVGGAILFSATDPQTQEQTWVTGVTNEGISANLITAGQLDTGIVQIKSGDGAVFRWDAYGLTAYDAQWADIGGISTISAIDTKKFVRFDKYGIYGIDQYEGIDGSVWHPNGQNGQEEIDEAATFALTWQGLKVTHPISNTESAVMRIGKFGDAPQRKIFEVTKGAESMMSFDEKGEFIVGGWHLYENGLSYGGWNTSNSIFLFSTGHQGSLGTFGSNTWRLAIGQSFGVSSSGTLFATGAQISGEINAGSGSIGAVGINSNGLFVTNSDSPGFRHVKLTSGGIEVWKDDKEDSTSGGEADTTMYSGVRLNSSGLQIYQEGSNRGYRRLKLETIYIDGAYRQLVTWDTN